MAEETFLKRFLREKREKRESDQTQQKQGDGNKRPIAFLSSDKVFGQVVPKKVEEQPKAEGEQPKAPDAPPSKTEGDKMIAETIKSTKVTSQMQADAIKNTIKNTSGQVVDSVTEMARKLDYSLNKTTLKLTKAISSLKGAMGGGGGGLLDMLPKTGKLGTALKVLGGAATGGVLGGLAGNVGARYFGLDDEKTKLATEVAGGVGTVAGGVLSTEGGRKMVMQGGKWIAQNPGTVGAVAAGGYAGYQGYKNASTLMDGDADGIDRAKAATHLAVSGAGGVIGGYIGRGMGMLNGDGAVAGAAKGAAYGAAAGDVAVDVANYVGEGLASALSKTEMGSAIQTGLGTVVDTTLAPFSADARERLGKTFSGLSETYDSISTSVVTSFKDISSSASGMMDVVSGTAGEAVSSISASASSVYGTISGTMGEMATTMSSKATDVMEGMSSTVGSIAGQASDVLGSIGSTVSSMASSITSSLSSFGQGAMDIAKSAKDTVAGMGAGAGEAVMGSLSGIGSFFKNAAGGLVPTAAAATAAVAPAVAAKAITPQVAPVVTAPAPTVNSVPAAPVVAPAPALPKMVQPATVAPVPSMTGTATKSSGMFSGLGATFAAPPSIEPTVETISTESPMGTLSTETNQPVPVKIMDDGLFSRMGHQLAPIFESATSPMSTAIKSFQMWGEDFTKRWDSLSTELGDSFDDLKSGAMSLGRAAWATTKTAVSEVATKASEGYKKEGVLGAVKAGASSVPGAVTSGTKAGSAEWEAAKTKFASGGEKGLGAVSSFFESGGKGVGTVSSGKGDAGGVSYGAHQLSSKTGTMDAFLKSPEAAKYKDQFSGMQSGSKEFNDAYKNVAGSDKEGFAQAQKDYITRTHYAPAAATLQQNTGLDVSKQSKALQEAVYSTSVQHGASGGASVMEKAWKNLPAGATDEDRINALQQYKKDNVSTLFKSSSPDVQASVAKRADREKGILLSSLADEKKGGVPLGSRQAGIAEKSLGKYTKKSEKVVPVAGNLAAANGQGLPVGGGAFGLQPVTNPMGTLTSEPVVASRASRGVAPTASTPTMRAPALDEGLAAANGKGWPTAIHSSWNVKAPVNPMGTLTSEPRVTQQGVPTSTAILAKSEPIIEAKVRSPEFERIKEKAPAVQTVEVSNMPEQQQGGKGGNAATVIPGKSPPNLDEIPMHITDMGLVLLQMGHT